MMKLEECVILQSREEERENEIFTVFNYNRNFFGVCFRWIPLISIINVNFLESNLLLSPTRVLWQLPLCTFQTR